MGCKVVKVALPNGESSNLFRELSFGMPGNRALETYLELTNKKKAFADLYGTNKQGEVKSKNFLSTPKFKLVEFNTYQQQVDTMELLASEFIDVLKSKGATASNTTLTGINLDGLTRDPMVIPEVIKEVRQNLIDESLNFQTEYTQEQIDLIQQAAQNLPSYLGADGRIGPLGAILNDYGINIEVADTFTEVESIQHEIEERNGTVDFEAKEVEYERIYDMDLLETSATNSILDQVKVYLRSQKRVDRKYKYSDRNPTPTYERSSLGEERPARYELMVSKLFGVLKGMKNVEEMAQRVQRSLKSAPELTPIYNDLVNEQPITLVDGTQYKPISSALFTTFAKEDYNMFTIAEKSDGSIVFTDSNASSTQSKVKGRWREAMQDLHKVHKTRKGKQAKTHSLKVLDLLLNPIVNGKSSPLAFDKSLNAPKGPNNITLSKVAKAFRNAGYDTIQKEDIASLIEYVQANPRVYRKGNSKKAISPSAIVRTYLNVLVRKSLDGKDVFVSNSEDYGERRSLNVLSIVSAIRMSDIHSGAFRSGRGTMIHPLNNSSEAQDFWHRLSSDEDTKQLFADDPMYRDTKILEVLTGNEHSGMFDVRVLDVLNDNTRRNSGKTYGKLSTFDALASRVNSYFTSVGDKKYFYSFSPTQADRGNLQVLVLPKMNTDNNGKDSAVFEKGKLADGEIKDWVRNRVKAEVTRIAKINDGNTPYDAYNKNGKKFNIFTELNSLPVADITSAPASISMFTNMAMEKMDADGIFKNIVEQDIQYYIDNGIFQKDGQGYKTTSVSSKALSKDIATGKDNARTITRLQMENFVANNFAYTYEQTLFYIGDPAYYKAASEQRQKVDMNKRFSLPFTPGVRLSVGHYMGIGATSKLKILQEGKFVAPLADVYNEITGASMFKDIEHADGAGFVSLKRYKQLMLSRGLHSDAMLRLIDDLSNWKQGDKAIQSEASLESLKSFYFRLQKAKDGSVAPFNLKYAIVPVIPSLFEAKVDGKFKHPVMAKISQELRRKGGADEVVMPTAVKVGQAHLTSIENLAEAETTTIYNDSVRFPQVSPSEQKTEDTFGSQIRNLIIGNYNSKSEVHMSEGALNADDALVLYNDAIKTIVEDGGDSVHNEFVNEGKINKQALIERLLKDVQSNTFNNAEYFQEALTVIGEAEHSLLPLSYPTIKYKLDNIINAAFRAKVNKLKLSGYSAVQISSYGMANKSEIDTDSDLKFVSFQTLDGVRVSTAKAMELAKQIKTKEGLAKVVKSYKVAPAEIRVTPKFFNGILKKVSGNLTKLVRESIDKEVSSFAEIIPDNLPPNEVSDALRNYKNLLIHQAKEREYKRLKGIITDKKGNFKVSEIKKAGLDEVVIYRIPTQGKNSMLIAKIEDFMPSELGGNVQVPAEIVDQSGSDFDIDKIHIEMSSFGVEDSRLVKQSYMNGESIDISSTDAAKEYIVDFHRAVLSSPDYIADLLLPNSTNTLSQLAKDFGVNDVDAGAWSSIRSQEEMRVNNKAGKEMISISSIASVAHSSAKHIGAHFIKAPVIAGKPVKLGEDNNFMGELISTEIAEIQNAAVDNASDPLLGKLNLDEFTSSAAILLVSAGHGLKFAAAVINAPIVKKLAAIYPKYTRKNSRKSAFSKAIKEVRKEFQLKGVSKSMIKNAFSLATYSEEAAMKIKDGTTPLDAAIALQAFTELQKLGDQLSDFQQSMRFNSVPSSVASLIEKYLGVAGIKGTNAHNREVKTKALLKRKERKGGAIFASRAAMVSTIQSASETIIRTADEKNYKNIENGKLYERLTNYIGNSIDKATLPPQRIKQLEASIKVGTVVDNVVRDFFTTGKILPSEGISTKALEKISDRLESLKQHFKNTGEQVITDPDMLKIYDDVLEVGGEQDLVTIDENKAFRIYDVKTAAKTKPSHYHTKAYGEEKIAERFIKRGKQLNGYRGLNRNTSGLVAQDLNIIEFHTIYNEDGTYIEDIGSSDVMFENHAIDDSIIRDTRVIDSDKAERILEKLGKKINLSSIAVKQDLYTTSHLSTMETYTLGKPLEVQRLSSPSASIQSQRVLRAVESAVGRLTENQQIKTLAAYDTYLALNTRATSESSTSLAKDLTPSAVLEFTDDTSPDSTASLLKSYREYIAKNGVPENQFTENLSIITKEGRSFVTFNNSIAKSLTGEAKKSMMFFFEDLMYSKDPMQFRLAKSLSDYAILHYGYEKSINSFMDFLPPQAHVEYMKGPTSTTTLAEHFRQLGDKFDNVDRFTNSAQNFAHMYVQNNADSLGLPKAAYGDINWQSTLAQDAMANRTPIPPYALTEGRSGTKLHQFIGGAYKMIQKRGIQNLMTEYQDFDSVVNDNPSRTDMTSNAAKSKASSENKVVMKSITEKSNGFPTFLNAMNTVNNFNDTIFKTTEQASAYLNDVITSVSSDLTAAEVGVLQTLTQFGINRTNRLANKKSNNLTFDEAFKKAMKGTIDTIDEASLDSRNKKIIHKIKTCE